jgi:hypothetical protein
MRSLKPIADRIAEVAARTKPRMTRYDRANQRITELSSTISALLKRGRELPPRSREADANTAKLNAAWDEQERLKNQHALRRRPF